MVAEGVTLSNAAWGSRPDLARVRRMTLFLDPISLLLGEVKIGRILLEGADIAVERNDVGDSNLEMRRRPTDPGRIPARTARCGCAPRRPSRGSAPSRFAIPC